MATDPTGSPGSTGPSGPAGSTTTAAPLTKPVPAPEGFAGLPPVTPSPTVQAPTTPAPATDPLAALSGDQRNAYAAVYQELQQEGLTALAPKLLQFAQQGFDSDTIALELQNTQEWKTRFAGNEQRVKNGFSVLSPADYLSTEAQLIATSKAFGLPSGFYDNTADVANLIGMNLSPAEYQARAQDAWNYTLNADPAAHQALQDFYGVGADHAAAFFIDPAKAQALVDKQSASATMGAIAIRNGVQGLGVNQAENLYAQGVTTAQAQQGLQQLGLVEPNLLAASQRFGSSYNAQDAVNDFVAGNAQAQRQRNYLSAEEGSEFSPTGGVVVGQPSLGSF